MVDPQSNVFTINNKGTRESPTETRIAGRYASFLLGIPPLILFAPPILILSHIYIY